MSGKDLETRKLNLCIRDSRPETRPRRVQTFWTPRWPSCLRGRATVGMRRTRGSKFILTRHPCAAASLEIFLEDMDLDHTLER